MREHEDRENEMGDVRKDTRSIYGGATLAMAVTVTPQ
jgi:hypothetical protein